MTKALLIGMIAVIFVVIAVNRILLRSGDIPGLFFPKWYPQLSLNMRMEGSTQPAKRNIDDTDAKGETHRLCTAYML